MTFKYHMPDHIFKVWQKNWHDPIVKAWLKLQPKRKCKHGIMKPRIGYFGIIAECNKCKGLK